MWYCLVFVLWVALLVLDCFAFKLLLFACVWVGCDWFLDCYLVLLVWCSGGFLGCFRVLLFCLVCLLDLLFGWCCCLLDLFGLCCFLVFSVVCLLALVALGCAVWVFCFCVCWCLVCLLVVCFGLLTWLVL